MNNMRPLEITTTTHAMAPWIYGLQVALGLGYVFSATPAESLTALTTPYGASLWAVISTFGGIAAFIAIRMARKSHFVFPALRIEMFAAGGIAISNLTYLVALFTNRGGIFDVYITKTLVIAVCGACLHRVFQIRKERRRIIERLNNPTTPAGVVADEEGK